MLIELVSNILTSSFICNHVFWQSKFFTFESKQKTGSNHVAYNLQKSDWAVLSGHPLPFDCDRAGSSASSASECRTTAIHMNITIQRHFLLKDLRVN